MKLPTSPGSSKKQESSRKTSISALLTMPKPLTVWITINCGQFWKTWEYQTTWPASWETYIQLGSNSRTGHGTTDWFQIGKGVCQGWILSPCLFNLYTEYIMRNTGLEEAQAGIKIARISAYLHINNHIQICPEHHAVNQPPIVIMKKMGGREALHRVLGVGEADGWGTFELSE